LRQRKLHYTRTLYVRLQEDVSEVKAVGTFLI